MTLAAGDIVYLRTDKLPNGTLTTNKRSCNRFSGVSQHQAVRAPANEHLTLPANEPNSTARCRRAQRVVAKKHHLLVRWSHWLNVRFSFSALF